MSPSDDLFSQRLRLIGRITSLFAQRGYQLIVVGGSALEFYSQGGYVSGDVDLCRGTGQSPIPAVVEKEVMLAIGAEPTGVRRQWKKGDTYIDLLGEVETAPDPNFRTLTTPEGPIRLMPAEDVLVERAFVAFSRGPGKPPDTSALAAARQMALVAMRLKDFDWEKAFAIAASPAYDILTEVKKLADEASRRTPKEP